MVKKSFPKIKKSLKWFLTDESWKVTKKDVLWISAWAWLISAMNVEVASACEHVSNVSHSSGCSSTSQWSVAWYTSWGHVSRVLRWSSSSIKTWAGSTAHASWIRTSSHGSSSWSNTTISSWSHLSYTARWSYRSQSSISWYSHSSGSTHSSWTSHLNWRMCP